jgi:hypothetical protein
MPRELLYCYHVLFSFIYILAVLMLLLSNTTNDFRPPLQIQYTYEVKIQTSL